MDNIADDLESGRWARVVAVYEAVADAPVERRLATLDAMCGGDAALRGEVDALLAQDSRNSPLDAPIWDTVAAMVNSAEPHLEIGTHLGPYVIEGVIGAGGMGEVYRARDTNLGRSVALKVLPRSWAADPERIARFQREAQMLAALNHPNIATIHGVEQSTGSAVRALVMELVDGPTLADRIARGPIPLEEALPIARQMADALEAAHEQGIVHRDLKPANVKLRPDDTVKVLDFGLAKPIESNATGDPSMSPTITTPAVTGVGVILGTAAYMSPEQAKGRAADRRSDIWAFGCVLYEMLTSVRAFQGEDVSDTLAAVLRGEPDWTRLPLSTPTATRRLLARCLTKNPRERLQHIGDARLELADSVAERGANDLPRGRERLRWIIPIAFAFVVAAAAIGWILVRQQRSLPGPEMRVDITTPPTPDPLSFAIAPDGRQLAFVASGPDAESRLWLRALNATSARPLDGTERARYPFWAPDSHSIAFFAAGQLKRLDVASGSIQDLAIAPAGYGGAWNRNDVILFAPSGGSAILRLDLRSPAPRAVAVTAHSSGPGHRQPQFLPDGEHFLFYGYDTHAVYVAGLSSNARRLLDADAAAVYAPTGHLLFVKQGKLFAHTLDLAQLTLVGTPTLLVDQIASSTEAGVAAVSTSPAGAIAYRTGSASAPTRQLAWVDRAGRTVALVGAPDGAAQSIDPVLSPDDRWIAEWRTENGNPDVWLVDAVNGRRLRVTTEPASDMFPVWSNDGRRIVFGSNRTGQAMEIFVRSASGGDEQMLLSNGDYNYPLDWSHDARFLLYGKGLPGQQQDLFVLTLTGERRSIPVAVSRYDERRAQFSPDGHWIAYDSNESGRFEVYVQPFPGPGPKTPISSGGGTQARWRPDCKELFFVAPDDRLMAVSVQINGDGAIDAGAPVPLFAAHLNSALQNNFRQQYAVSRDGTRFLLNRLNEAVTSTPITLLLNWRGDQR